MNGQAGFSLRDRNPDVLTCIANLSNDEVFTPPEFANRMLDTIAESWAADNGGANIWADKTVRFLDPCTKSGVFLREITSRLTSGLADKIPNLEDRVDHILTKQVFGIGITSLCQGGGRGTRTDRIRRIPSTGPPETALIVPIVPLSWSADGHRILYRVGAGAQSTVWMLERPTKRTYELEGLAADAAGTARLSPDGRWVVYTSTDAGRTHVYVSPATGRGTKWPVSSADGGSQPRWSRDGQEIFYRSPRGELMAAEVKVDTNVVTVGRIRSLFSFGTPGRPAPYDVSVDGQRFLVAESGTVPDSELTVVLNWTTLLE